MLYYKSTNIDYTEKMVIYNFRKEMDAYSKQQYYPIKKWLTGIKADLAKLMSSTLQKTLRKIGFKLDSSPQHISCEWIFGSDGAGYRKFHLKFVMVTVLPTLDNNMHFQNSSNLYSVQNTYKHSPKRYLII